MTEQDRLFIENVRRMYDGEEAEAELIAPDIVWHVPGHNPVSGEYRGRDEYLHVMTSRMAPLSRWDFEVQSMMVNGSYVMTTYHVMGERKGRRIDMNGGHLMRLDEKGQIVEGWGFADDQDTLDAFFGA